VPFAERQDIDRWVLSKLQELVRTGEERLAEFDTPALVRKAEAFIQELSTWYVRRCRRRFWRPKSTDDRDKLAAFQTLHEVLVVLCRALAPIVPFLTEAIYQNLVRTADAGAPESVHHCPYPTYDEALHDEDLAREMDAALQVVSLALSARESRSLRVRQPLARLIVVPADDTQRRAVIRFEDHILDELNIKRLEISADAGGLVEVAVKPNFKALGPKYGKSMKQVAAAVAAAASTADDRAALASAVAVGETVRLQGDGGPWELLSDELVVERRPAEGYAVSEDRGLIVAVDAEVTPELEREGLARDLIRHIQQRRKELDLEVTDRIAVAYDTEAENLLQAIDEHRGRIAAETLALELERAGGGGEIRILGQSIQLAVRKAPC
jgi:isoleucyl-tRNA synthetase